MKNSAPNIVARAFGRFSASVGGNPLPLSKEIAGEISAFRPAVKALFAFLAEKREPRTRQEIAEAFWPEDPQNKGDRGLSTLLGMARRAFGEWGLSYSLFVSTREGIALSPEIAVQYDLWAARGLMDSLQSEDTALNDLPILARRLSDLTAAPYLEDLSRFQWVRDSRQAIEEAISWALLVAKDRLQTAGREDEFPEPPAPGLTPNPPAPQKAGQPDPAHFSKAGSRYQKKGSPAPKVEPKTAEKPGLIEQNSLTNSREYGEGPSSARQVVTTVRLFAAGSYGHPSARIYDVAVADTPSAQAYEVQAISPVDAAMAAACRILKDRPAQKIGLWVRDQVTGQASRVNLQACLKPVDIRPWSDASQS